MTDPNPPETSPPKRRKRFGLSLRVLMVLVLLLGGGMGWLTYRVRVQREAVAAIEAAGGKVYYDLEWEYGEYGLSPRKPRWPKWLVDHLGPDYLGHVIAVQFLRGPSNQADDEVMVRIGRLSALEDLEFGAFDFKNMKSFSEKCRVTDAGIAHLRGLGRLRRLQLEGTSVNGPGLIHLTGLSALKHLDLGGIPITDQDASPLSTFMSLEELSVDSETLTDAGMVYLARLTQLKSLDLNAKSLAVAGLERLKGLNRLESLSLWVDSVEDYRFLSQFPELTRLRLRLRDRNWRPFDGFLRNIREQRDLGLTSLGALSKLRDLSISGNSYPESLLAHIGRLEGLENLTLLSLRGAPPRDFSQLSGLTRLESLSLIGTSVDDSTLANLSGLQRIKSLSVAINDITDAGLAHLSGLTDLETLSLDYTKVTDSGLLHLVSLKKCKHLTVRNTRVTVDGFSAFRAKQEEAP